VRKSFVGYFNLWARATPSARAPRVAHAPYAGRVQRTTVEGVRIAWARSAHDSRRETADALVRALAGELAPGSDLRIERRCPVCGGPHGRPVLPFVPVHASIAYADPWVVVAVAHAENTAEIGIDAERAGARPDLAALFAPADPPDLRGWTAIEAVLKADGRGLMVPPDEVRLFPGGTALGPDGTAYLVLSVVAAPGMVVSLALRS
jgi:4'-phosphopantetheinyl transferase